MLPTLAKEGKDSFCLGKGLMGPQSVYFTGFVLGREKVLQVNVNTLVQTFAEAKKALLYFYCVLTAG